MESFNSIQSQMSSNVWSAMTQVFYRASKIVTSHYKLICAFGRIHSLTLPQKQIKSKFHSSLSKSSVSSYLTLRTTASVSSSKTTIDSCVTTYPNRKPTHWANSSAQVQKLRKIRRHHTICEIHLKGVVHRQLSIQPWKSQMKLTHLSSIWRSSLTLR